FVAGSVLHIAQHASLVAIPRVLGVHEATQTLVSQVLSGGVGAATQPLGLKVKPRTGAATQGADLNVDPGPLVPLPSGERQGQVVGDGVPAHPRGSTSLLNAIVDC